MKIPTTGLLALSLVLSLSFAVGLKAESEAAKGGESTRTEAKPTAVRTTPDTERRTIQQDGLTFTLARSARADTVETEEYFLEGENAETWSQMIAYQRVALPEPVGADQYVGWLKRQLEQHGSSPRVRILQQGKSAAIFGVQYDRSENAAEQFGLALATIADPRRPNELHLIQYLVSPSRMSIEDMEVRVKRWQARFQSQAASLSR